MDNETLGSLRALDTFVKIGTDCCNDEYAFPSDSHENFIKVGNHYFRKLGSGKHHTIEYENGSRGTLSENFDRHQDSQLCNDKKIGAGLSKLFSREMFFNREVENRRLALFATNKLSPMFYFRLIDVTDCGYLDFSLMSLFMKKQKFTFTVEDWTLL